MKPLFGNLNNRVSKALARDVPRMNRLVEPFGDYGTYAMTFEKRRPRAHVLNIQDPIYFEVMRFVQAGARRDIAGFDWISSEETFQTVLAIAATEGAELFYRWFYLKKFGAMAMGADKETADPEWDWTTVDEDLKFDLFALSMMKPALKGVEITNEEAMAVFDRFAGAGNFLLLLPKTPEEIEAVESRLGSLGAEYFYARKVADPMEAADMLGQFGAANVGMISLPGIMVSDGVAVWNFEGTALEPLTPEMLPAIVGGS